MNKMIFAVVGSFVGGAAVGGLVTYKLVKTKANEGAARVIDDICKKKDNIITIDDIRKKQAEKADLHKKVENGENVDPPDMIKKTNKYISNPDFEELRAKYSAASVENLPKEDVEPDPLYNYEENLPDVYYVLDEEEYHEENGYLKEYYIYYSDDGALATDTNDLIPNVRDVLGDAAFSILETKEDDTPAYFRNDFMETDIEVEYVIGSYEEMVLGLEREPEVYKKAKKEARDE